MFDLNIDQKIKFFSHSPPSLTPSSVLLLLLSSSSSSSLQSLTSTPHFSYFLLLFFSLPSFALISSYLFSLFSPLLSLHPPPPFLLLPVLFSLLLFFLFSSPSSSLFLLLLYPPTLSSCSLSLFIPTPFFFLNMSSAQINCKAPYSVHSESQRRHSFSLGSICWWFILFKFIQSHYLNVNSQIR